MENVFVSLWIMEKEGAYIDAALNTDINSMHGYGNKGK